MSSAFLEQLVEELYDTKFNNVAEAQAWWKTFADRRYPPVTAAKKEEVLESVSRKNFYQGLGTETSYDFDEVLYSDDKPEMGEKPKIMDSVNPSKKLNGRKIINSDLSGKTVETKGGLVRFDENGFPDFTPYSQKTVRVENLTGDMANDVPLTMEKAGLTSYDTTKYVWHHHQDGTSMMLVPKNIHSVRNGGVAHTGGRAVIQHNLENPGNKINYPSPPEI